MTDDRPLARRAGSGVRGWSVLALLVLLATVATVAAVALRGEEPVAQPAAGATPSATGATPSATGARPPATGSASPEPGSGASPTTSAPVEAVPAPAGPPLPAEELPAALPAADLEAAVDVDEVTVSLASMEAIDGQATGPGDIAGPALRVTVRIENGSGAVIDLGGVTVNLGYGTDPTPATPLGDPSAEPFTGSLAPGRSATAVYVFGVPPSERGSVLVEVSHRPGAVRVVFTGAVA